MFPYQSFSPVFLTSLSHYPHVVSWHHRCTQESDHIVRIVFPYPATLPRTRILAIFLGGCSSAPVYSISRVSREPAVSSRHIQFIVTAGAIKSVLPACVSARCPPSMWWLHLAGVWYSLYVPVFLTSLSHYIYMLFLDITYAPRSLIMLFASCSHSQSFSLSSHSLSHCQIL